MSFREHSKDVASSQDLADFIGKMLRDYQLNKDSWENVTLEAFLEAMSAWVEDMDGYYTNVGETFDDKNPTWSNFSDILSAATMYE
ncbi:hypothetical protein [Motiliproteus sp. MSK22-1]|uniref:DUF7660 family protein n=1 Tax=Motiliproteus sp. MSK22-1 TaxID=1897630 RepID=UPI000975DC69|nr:hypothetical protein [Motiliproteus sp. MSK22-1]OMH29039.1 hypothetical protein BGP75_19980 [Motiliproteus sp. MSK22-1]